jgi:hypothetical protein
MGQPIEQGGRHFCIAEHPGPFAEAQVSGDDYTGALIKLAEQMEEQGAAGCAERQVAEFIQDHQITTNQPVGNLPGFSLRLFLLQRVDEFDGGVKPSLLPMMLNGLNDQSRSDVRLAGPRRSSDILLGIRTSRENPLPVPSTFW